MHTLLLTYVEHKARRAKPLAKTEPVARVRFPMSVRRGCVRAGVVDADPVGANNAGAPRDPSPLGSGPVDPALATEAAGEAATASEQLVNDEPDLALITDPRSGRPIVPGQRQVGELNAMLDTPWARNAGSFLHPTEYGEVYGGVSSGDGASGDGASGAREGAGGAGGGGKKPRVEDAGEHGSADEMET